MSLKNTTETIKNWESELTAVTSVTPNPDYNPSLPTGPNNQPQIIGQFSCERLELLIDEYVKKVTDIITSKAESIANIVSDWAPLLSLPSDPMKILKWASKVVGGPIAAQIALITQIAVEIAQLASALAGLVGAVASAVANLISCFEQAIFDAFNDVIDSLLTNAANLVATAENIVDDIINQALDNTGLADVITDINNASAILDTSVITTLESFEDINSSIESVGTATSIVQNRIELDKLSLINRLETDFDNIVG